MSCATCPALAERYCPKCQRRFCASHDGHTLNGSLHFCPFCSRKSGPVLLEKFGDRALGFAMAPPGTPIRKPDEDEDDVNAGEVWEDEDNYYEPTEEPTGEPPSEIERMYPDEEGEDDE